MHFWTANRHRSILIRYWHCSSILLRVTRGKLIIQLYEMEIIQRKVHRHCLWNRKLLYLHTIEESRGE